MGSVSDKHWIAVALETSSISFKALEHGTERLAINQCKSPVFDISSADYCTLNDVHWGHRSESPGYSSYNLCMCNESRLGSEGGEGKAR